MVDQKLVPVLAQLSQDENPGIRAAAAECLWALSRSFRALRVALGEPEVAEHLLALLGDGSESVRTHASAALCNMSMEYLPVKEQLLAAGTIPRFAAMALDSSTGPELRINALWALKNLTFGAGSKYKRAVTAALPWESLVRLVKGPDLPVAEQALAVLRNLTHGEPSETREVFEWSQGKLPTLLLDEMPPADAAAWKRSSHALYVAANLATGFEDIKDGLMTLGLGRKIAWALQEDRHPDVQVAALWCVINLAWQDTTKVALRSSPRAAAIAAAAVAAASGQAGVGPSSPSSGGVAARAAQLQALGVDGMVARLASDKSLSVHVSERAKNAQDVLQRALGHRPGQQQQQPAEAEAAGPS